jgi:hypothetical protein
MPFLSMEMAMVLLTWWNSIVWWLLSSFFMISSTFPLVIFWCAREFQSFPSGLLSVHVQWQNSYDSIGALFWPHDYESRFLSLRSFQREKCLPSRPFEIMPLFLPCKLHWQFSDPIVLSYSPFRLCHLMASQCELRPRPGDSPELPAGKQC